MTRKTFFKLFLFIILVMFVLCGGLLLAGNIGIGKLPLEKAEKKLRVITMNVSADNILSTSLQDNLIKTQPDIIIVIEWTGNNLDLDKFATEGYQAVLNHPRKKVHGICVLSKLKGISTILEAPIETPCTLPVGQFRFNWQDKDFTLFAIHAPPPVPSCKGTTSSYLKAIADWIEQGQLSSSIGIGKKGDIILVAGDFNSLAFEDGMKMLRRKQLTDSYSEYNFIAPTWKPFRLFPYLARIDYILFSTEINATLTKRFTIENSDHLGILTDLTF